ncbi:TlpA family protein disulfide reductase [Rhodocaloribacter litoris]|uniref:peroxiredoxin family protein n=1 Tax=Rhodocaloribacter litoris TaxID=2558931 RepID=UPI00141F168D|nr:TlpA disulfide reductase family protein [Rhodocaloribacter litoris]QXD15286.1 TlpA family protein disulfide reductase [Rhodocaloribacter litoris]
MTRICLLIPFVAGLLWVGCGPGGEDPGPVRSRLEGRLSVAAEVDSTGDYGGFEVLVVDNSTGDVDTLGRAVTDSTGAFGLDVRAPFRGIFPLLINRAGAQLYFGELVVAHGDTARIQATFPLRRPSLVVRGSRENGAWMAYRSAKDHHTRVLSEVLREQGYEAGRVANTIRQTSNLMWGLQQTYPGTLGATVAAAEAVVMLDGWDDALLVERARQLPPDHPNLVEVMRAARRAQARLRGQEAALALLREFQARTPSNETWAGLQSEVVLAYIDSLQQDEALAAAQELARRAPDGRWVRWSDRAVYELENLMPGMPAPGFVVTTLDGRTVRLDSLRGRVVVLEFYAPRNEIFLREVGLRNRLYRALDAFPVTVVAVSLDPDTLITEAFLEGRDIPGLHVVAPGGLDGPLAGLYNVNLLPTRYLIGPDGTIVSKYVGSAMVPLQIELAGLLGLRPRTDAPVSAR